MTAKRAASALALFIFLAVAAVAFFANPTTGTRLIGGVALGLAVYAAGNLG